MCDDCAERYENDDANRIANELGDDEPFYVYGDYNANRAVRYISDERAEADRLIAIAEEEIKRLQARIRSVNEHCERKTAYAKSQLEAYFDTVPHKATKTMEKYALLSGTLVRKMGGKDYPRDDQQIIEWALQAGFGEFVKTKYELRWSALKGRIIEGDDGVYFADPATGVASIVPGLSAVQKPDTFTIEFVKEEQQ